jgi:hypothetical protein
MPAVQAMSWKIKAINTHFNDQWHASQAKTFREMSRDKETFDRASRRKYARNAREHERKGGR